VSALSYPMRGISSQTFHHAAQSITFCLSDESNTLVDAMLVDAEKLLEAKFTEACSSDTSPEQVCDVNARGVVCLLFCKPAT